jgi:hypothetical protein
MILTIHKKHGSKFFYVEDLSLPGSPPMGRGRTMKEAIGDWLFYNRKEVDVEFAVDDTARPAEMRRRQRELRKR